MPDSDGPYRARWESGLAVVCEHGLAIWSCDSIVQAEEHARRLNRAWSQIAQVGPA